jgi:hypothetical protein
MVKGYEVLQMLIPSGGWVIEGDNFEGITFIECEPISKTQFEEGFAICEIYKAEQDAAKAAQKAALLDRLGITEEEVKLLLA